MHMTCTIIQREKYQKRAMDIEINKDRCSSQVEGLILRAECNEPLSQV